MSAQEKLKVWWIDTEDTTRRVFAISAVISLVLAVLLSYSDIRGFLSAHPLWQDFLVALPAIALPVLAWFELGHSAEANRLRSVADGLRREENRLQEQIGQLMARLLEQIASNTQGRQAERNAEILRKYIGACVPVLEGRGIWSSTPLIVEVSDANIVTLFTPSAGSSPQAKRRTQRSSGAPASSPRQSGNARSGPSAARASPLAPAPDRCQDAAT